MTLPTDATPPALRKMQIKMSELTHAMAEVAAVPAAYRQYDNRLETLKEEFKTLRERIDDRAGSLDWRSDPWSHPSSRVRRAYLLERREQVRQPDRQSTEPS